MAANADNFSAKRKGNHPSKPQETRKSAGAAVIPPKTLPDFALMGTMVRLGRLKLGWSQELLAEKLGCDVKTIQNVESGRTQKAETLRLLRDLLVKELVNGDFPTLEALLSQKQEHDANHAKAENGIERSGSESIAKLDSSASESLDRDYVALARDGRYDSAASLAKRAVAGAEAAEDKCLIAHWADRVADAYRAIGMLREASAFYAVSWSKAQEALAQTPDDLALRYQIGKTRFGQIMVDDYLVRGAFAEAHNRHAHLLSDVEALLRDGVPDSLRAEISHRRIHIKRQKAEMLRYLGRYSEALKTIRGVLSEYPASAYEPRSYARLSEADSLRLQGDMKAASTIYMEVETTARERHLDGLLGAVLWRKACLLQLDDSDGQFDNCLKEVAQLADDHPQRYRFMVIYSLLLRASGKVTDANTATGALKNVEKFGPLRPDYLVAEYAHVALCRGELLRQSPLKADALAWFQKAFDCYLRMECRWGMTRAWIGVRLAGGDADFPSNVKRTLEGTDAKLYQKFERNREIQPGILSMNIP